MTPDIPRDEIADLVGRRPWTIIHFAASRGVFISSSALIARRAVCPASREDALRRMAADYGKTAAEALDDLLTFRSMTTPLSLAGFCA